jgi:hypothetical protein
MKKISLSWNSRTPENIVTNDENFVNISEFIKKGKGDKWILNFYSYDNNESKAFIEKLQTMLMESMDDKNFLCRKEEIHFYSRVPHFQPHNVLQKLKRIQMHRSGVVILYEPIDYSYVISEHLDEKLGIHQELAEIFEKRSLMLLLFGNIPYDIHYFRGNSPLTKFLWREYKIKEYGKDELNVLCHLKENVGKNIVEYSEGNFELAHGLETFWEEIELEGLVTGLVNNFLEVPLRTKIEKLVYEKLAALSHFLENNKDKIKNKIDYGNNKKIRIIREKGSKLFKAYFDKTALFDCKEVSHQLKSFYELTPREVFENPIRESGFIENKGKIQPSVENNKDEYSDIFAQIASYFHESSPTFILGAGNSLTSGAPDRIKMFRHILKTIYKSRRDQFENMSNDEIKNEFQELVDSGHRRDNLLSRVREQLDALKPSIGHFYLSQLIKAGKIKVLITTNFDTLLEDSLMDYGIRSRKFIRLVAKEIMDINQWKWVNKFPELLKIFKICGDIYYGSWLAVDDKSAKTWIKKTVPVMRQVNAFRDSDFFIILGHKFDEINLSNIFDNKAAEDLTIVYANPDESDCKKFLQDYDHYSNDIIPIKGSYGEFDNFMQELSSRLKEK